MWSCNHIIITANEREWEKGNKIKKEGSGKEGKEEEGREERRIGGKDGQEGQRQGVKRVEEERGGYGWGEEEKELGMGEAQTI